MNLHLDKIEPFCTTDTQKELLKKIKKIQKFRIRRFSDSYLLEGLLFSFYVEEKFEPVMLYYDEIISLPFDESFPLWDDFWDFLSIFYINPLCTQAQKEAIFVHYEEVLHHKVSAEFADAQLLFTDFFKNILSLKAVKEREKTLQRALKDNDLQLEFAMRMSLVLYPTRVIIANNGENKDLEEQMQATVDEQTAVLRSGKFSKYI